MDSKMKSNIMLYEELSMNAHPAMNTMVYDGWLMRFSNGFTNRANSISPICTGEVPLEEKIDHCENIYANQGLNTVYKLTALSEELDPILAAKGYEIVTPTYIMTKPLDKYQTLDKEVVIEHEISDEWQEWSFKLHKIDNKVFQEVSRAIRKNIVVPKITVLIMADGKPIACGLAVIDRECVGLYDIVVHEQYRKQGYGFNLCVALLNEAKKLGAKDAYLQVVEENISARNLYSKLGYTFCYKYWYRVKVNQ